MRARRWDAAVLAALVALFLAQAALASPRKSASFDEQYHLAAGYSYLRTGDPRLATTHPPLMGALAALPLLARDDVALPLDHPTWEQANRFDFSDVWLWFSGNDAPGLLEWARWPIMLTGALLVAAVFLWGRRLFGLAGGALAGFFVALDPNLVANARQVNSDMGVTAFTFVAVWLLWRWLEARRRLDLALFGVAAGLTLAAKYNGLLIWPLAGAIALLHPVAPGLRWGPAVLRRAGGLLAAALVSLGVLWAVYGFATGPVAALPVAIPLPAPAYWQNLWGTFTGLVAENALKPDFLLGAMSTGGWWYYVPVAIAVKTPIPTLIFVVAGIVAMLTARRAAAAQGDGDVRLETAPTTQVGEPETEIPAVDDRRSESQGVSGVGSAGHPPYDLTVPRATDREKAGEVRLETTPTTVSINRSTDQPITNYQLLVTPRRQAALWLPPLVFLAVALTGLQTIGYRHVLPALPFAILLGGNAARWLAGPRPRLAWASAGVLAAWLVIANARVYPHQESYFNELAGPWANWSNILVDSNLDWGQDLPALRAVMDDLGIERVNLAYFGKAVPEAYGVRYTPLPGFLRFMGGREVNAWNPVAPEPGWYAISATSLRLGNLQLEPDGVDLYAWFRERTPDARAGYSIYLYRVEDAPATVVRPLVAVGTPVAGLPSGELTAPAGARVQARWVASPETAIYPQGEGFAEPSAELYHPVGTALGDGADSGGTVFTLRGYVLDDTAARPGDTLDVRLVWEAGERPMPQPAPTRGEALAAFVHLLPAAGGSVAVQFDGWETALRGLAPGDVIVQPAPIALPPDLPPGEYRLLAGLYSPQDGARLVTPQGADAVELGTVTVQP